MLDIGRAEGGTCMDKSHSSKWRHDTQQDGVHNRVHNDAQQHSEMRSKAFKDVAGHTKARSRAYNDDPAGQATMREAASRDAWQGVQRSASRNAEEQ